MSKKIYTCDACHYTFEAETGCDQCPDCGTGRSLPLRPVFHNRVI